jgi:hypothetical protein
VSWALVVFFPEAFCFLLDPFPSRQVSSSGRRPASPLVAEQWVDNFVFAAGHAFGLYLSAADREL